LYSEFIDQPLNNKSSFQRVRCQQKILVVLTRAEVAKLLSITGHNFIEYIIFYVSGLRRVEATRLRVKDFDFDHLKIQVWNGKRL
jgi:integrase